MVISSSFPLVLPEEYSSSYFQNPSEPLPTFSLPPPNKRPKCDIDNLFDFNHQLLTQLLSFDTPHPHLPTSLTTPHQEMNFSTQQYDNFNNTYLPSDISSNSKRPRTDPEDDSTVTANAGTTPRRLWVKNRSNAWWEQVNSPDFPDHEFKKAFRMSKATFTMICDELEPFVTKKDTMLRLAIPVRQRVAVCIWRLATGEALREVSKRFGLGISTCHKLILEVCTAIKTVLMPKFLQWPDENWSNGIKREFEAVYGIPNVIGSMYTTHIPIVAPKNNVAAYFNKKHTERNQKSSYSVTIQGVVDPNGVFTDISIRCPGSMSNEQVLENSSLFQRANTGNLNNVCVVADTSFPLMDWLLVPYSDQNVTWTKHAFNEKMEGIRGVSKDAFKRLKGRWGCLQKRTEMKLQDLPFVLGACCVLHNICEMRDEAGRDEMSFDVFDDEIVSENSVRSVNAAKVRDQIAHKLLHYARPNFS